MHKLSFGLRVLLGLIFIGTALGKFTGSMDSMRDQLEIASWFWLVIAAIELVGGVGLLVSLWAGRLALPFGLLFVAFMFGAVVSHIRVDDPVSAMTMPVALFLLSLVVSGIELRQAGPLHTGIASRYRGADEV